MRRLIVLLKPRYGVAAYVFLFLLLVQGLDSTVLAQEAPAAEVFLAPSYMWHNASFYGWQAAITSNVRSWAGVTVEGSGHYLPNSDLFSIYTLRAGPQFSRRASAITLFTHALVGAAFLRDTSTGTLLQEKGFSGAAGGGLDVNLGDTISWRILQVDYDFMRPAGDTSLHGGRAAMGIVIKIQ